MLNKFIIPILLVTLSGACHNGKKDETQVNPDEIKDNTNLPPDSAQDGKVVFQLNYTGVVRDMTKTEGCGWMIEIDGEDGGKILLEPLTLPIEYQVDGKVIEFAFTNSKRQSTCTVPSRPVTIDNIIK